MDKRNSGKIQDAPHEYYICSASQRLTLQKSTSEKGGLSEVPSLIHNGVLMYMRTVTEPRGTLLSVCAPAGLRRPCAHTSDSRIPIRRHLSNPQKIVNTVTDYPATVHRHYRYRGACVWGAWARNVSIGRGTRRLVSEEGRGIRTRVRITDPTPQSAWCMHVTRGSTQHRYTEIPRPPQPKTKLLDVLLERAARARSCRRAAEHGSGVMILEYKTARHKQATLRSVPRSKL